MSSTRACAPTPNIYAIGDVATDYRLAHIASAMGIVAAETIAGHPTVTLDYRMLPRCTYSQPQVASFGCHRGQGNGATKSTWAPSVRCHRQGAGLGDRDGFVKIIADAKYGEILGAPGWPGRDRATAGTDTGAHNNELTAEEIARNVHAHPTLSEALMEAAYGVRGEAIHI